MADNVVKHNQIQEPLSISTDKGEPASQWASSTLNALGPVVSDPHPYDEHPPKEVFNLPPSIPVTPGQPSVPGAYPTGHLNPEVITQDMEYIKGTAFNTLETAKGYLVSAGERVGEYLPKSMAAYMPHLQTEPTLIDDVSPEDISKEGTRPQELADVQLKPENNPANTSEMSKFKPLNNSLNTASNGADVDASTRTLFGSHHGTLEHSDTTSLLSASQNESDRPDLQHRNKDETKLVPTLPTHADIVNTTPREHPVAAIEPHRRNPEHEPKGKGLPDSALRGTEIAPLDPQTAATNAPIAANTAKDKGLPDTPLKDSNINPLHPQSDNRTGLPDASLNNANIAPLKPQTDSSTGLPDTSLNDTKIQPLDPQSTKSTHQPNTTDNIATNTKLIGTTTKGMAPSNPTQIPKAKPAPAPATIDSKAPTSHTKSSSPTKPGFMTKLKGEMKVLSGKLENNSEKVEQGKVMMGKAAKF